MARNELIKAPGKTAAEFQKLFGPPPLFEPEDNKIYTRVLAGLAQDEKPRTFIAQLLVRELADLIYQRLWLRRLGTRLVRHAHKEEWRKHASDVRSAAEDRKRELRENYARSPKSQLNDDIRGADKSNSEAEKALKAEIAKIDAETRKTVRLFSEAEEDWLDDAATVWKWIERYERVQSLLADVDKKFSDTLKLLDEYRQGLGQRLRQVADEIVDVEFEETSSKTHERPFGPAGSTLAAVKTVAPPAPTTLPAPIAEPVVSPPQTLPLLQGASPTTRRRLQSARFRLAKGTAPSSSQGPTRSNVTDAPSQTSVSGARAQGEHT